MIRQKILFLFDHPLALRSYTETGLIAEFNRDYDISIIIMGNIDNYSNQIMNLRISKIESFILSIYANIYWIKIAEKSLSIQNRVWHSKNKFKGFFSAPRIAIFYSRLFSGIPVKAFSLLLFRIFRFLDFEVKKFNPSKIVYITVGGTLTLSDFLCNRYRPDIELITILENWDNMSSKAVFAFPPKKIGVWGDQSVNFAESIHDIKRSHVKPIGNPRIDWLLDNVGREKNKTSIFFGGGSVDLDAEIEFLIATLEIAKKFELKIDYLPHPKNYRNIQKFIVHKNLSEINFIGDFHALNSNNQILLPKLIDYVNPFQSAKIFVSSLSTMNLEAALLKIPSVAIDLRTNLRVLPNKISDRHDHIFEAKQMGIFNFVSSIKEYEELLKNLLESNGIENPKYNSKSDLNYFVKTDKPFINNFLKLINS